MDNEPKKHHYVPQFYMRQLACVDDINKIAVVERHRDLLASERKSIGSIGYEERLHNFVENGVAGSIEGEINATVETPFSNSRTWEKISNKNFGALDAGDGLAIYGFARHLQRRNLAMLRFMERENERFVGGLLSDLAVEEREMHEWFAETTGGVRQLFRHGALDTLLPEDADEIGVMVCNAPIPFRSSTNPTLMISHPGQESVFGPMFNSLRTWWLTLDRNWGALIIAGGPAGFSCQSVESAVAHIINRHYLVQMLNGDARYLMADDPHIESDLVWAGFQFEERTTKGFRYRADSWKGPSGQRS